MYHGKIEATRFDLFDCYHENVTLIGAKPKPRKAAGPEIIAYGRWLASKAGLYPFADATIAGEGVTFGDRLKGPVWDAATRSNSAPIYENGAYSIPFPGRNVHRDTVTLETLDEVGNVIASQTLPVEPKKGGVIWDAKAVRQVVGPVTKLAKARKVKATAPVRENDAPAPIAACTAQPPIEAQEPVADAAPAAIPEIAPESIAAAPVALPDVEALESLPCPAGGENLPDLDLVGEIEGLKRQVAALMAFVEAFPATPIGGNDPTPSIEEIEAPAAAPWQGARDLARMRDEAAADARAAERARRLRIIRAYLRMRRERNAARADIARIKTTVNAIPTYSGESGRESPDIIAMSSQRAFAAQEKAERVAGELATARATIATMGKRVDAMADELLSATVRASRAENALAAIEARQARAGQPYRVNVPAVRYQRAA